MPPLRTLRTAQWMTRERLATRAGVARSTIAHIEAGGRPPRRRLIERIAAVLQVDPAEIDEFRPVLDGARLS